MHNTLPLLACDSFPPLKRRALGVLQVNLGYVCNLSCVHCHVNAGPKRSESMAKETIDAVLRFATASGVHSLDLTGGAPELHPQFRTLVKAARMAGLKVIDRCNLVVLLEPEQVGLAEFLAEQQVEVVASLPCYLQENVDRQRGKGVFQDSIAALRLLNSLGYGQDGGDLRLNLVFNPQGAVLPPAQDGLEQAYKAHLAGDYGISFNRLYAIANMPIQRFGSTLVSKGQFDAYLQLLREHFNPANLEQLMCLDTLSVDWQGWVYDCDFNQMLGLPLGMAAGHPMHISELSAKDLPGAAVATAAHCYACTAGQGSGCGGALGDGDHA